MRLLALVVFLAGLAGVLAFATLAVDRGPFERSPVGVEQANLLLARGIHAGEENQGTLYPRLLSVLSVPWARVLSPLVGDPAADIVRARRILTLITLPLFALLVWALARRRSGPWPAALAGLVAAASAPALLVAGSLEPVMPAALAALAALVAIDGRPGWPRWILAGLLAGVAARFVPAVGWALGALLLPVALFRGGASRRAVAAAALVVAWTAAVVGSGALAPRESRFATVNPIEFYQGHRAESRGLVPQRVDRDEARWWGPLELQAASSRAAGRLLSGDEIDRWCVRTGIVESLTAPHRTALRGLVKTAATLQGEPLPREVSARFLAERSEKPGLGLALWLGRILLPLGLAGILVNRRRAGAALWVGLGTGVLAAWLGYAQPAYQLVTVAAAAGGVALLTERLARGPRRFAAVLAAVVVTGAALAAPAIGLVPGLATDSLDHEYLGLLYLDDGRGSAAMREFDRALNLDPGNPYPRLALADMLAEDQVGGEAITELESVTSSHPELIQPRVFLARLYENQERWLDAARAYESLAQLCPWDAEYVNNLGTDLVKAGYYDRAEGAFRAALGINPDYEVARRNLDALVAQGFAIADSVGRSAPRTAQEFAALVVAALRAENLVGADSLLAEAYRAVGTDDVSLRFAEATLRIKQGRPDEGVKILESLRPVMGDNEILLNNLAAAYAQAERLPEAIAIWEDLLKRNPANELLRGNIERARRQLAGE